MKTFPGHSASIVALDFISDLLISGSFYGDLKIWMIHSSFTGPVHFEREAHDLGVTCLATLSSSPNEQTHLIASGGNDNRVKIWQCSSSSKHHLKRLRTLKKHTCAVMCVSFGIEHYLASGSGDKTIVIWNYETGQAIHQFDAHTRYVTCCAFSLDGQYLATGSNDRVVNVWKIAYGEADQKQNDQEPQQYQLNSIDQWTHDMVQQWLRRFRVGGNFALTGSDLLSKSDQEILALFNDNEQLLNELTSLRHENFIKKLAVKKSNGTDEQNTSLIPNEYLCPITHELMVDPVCASDGYSYERKAIEEWLLKKQTSPIMNSPIQNKQLYPNKILRMLIDKYVQQR